MDAIHDKGGNSTGKGGRLKRKTGNSITLMNPLLLDPKVKEGLISVCQKDGTFELDGSIEAFSEPFRCCALSNFIDDEEFLEALRNELLDQIFMEKNNDLYKFQQTDDVKKFSSPHAKRLRKVFLTEVRSWLQEVSGIELSDKLDMTCSRYDFTDTLLCHDDELSGRRIAFVLYLTPYWHVDDRGTLDLFNVDDHGQPKEVVKSILPKWNNFVFFLVDPVSFHQVSEVMTEDKTRLSLNGWFHGPPIDRPTPYVEPAGPLLPHVHIEQDVFLSWLNPIYLDSEVQRQIQEKFQQESEIELKGFLKDDKLSELSEVLAGETITWELVGPPNKRRYDRAADENLPVIVEECLRLFQSEAMFLTLSNLTGLSLHHLAVSRSDDEGDDGESSNASENESDDGDVRSSSRRSVEKQARKRVRLDMESTGAAATDEPGTSRNPRCRREFRRWGQGSYTLLHDTDPSNTEFALDARISFNCSGWTESMGGFVSYISKGEDEELLTVNPSDNSLALVYRDKDTLRSVKHVNNTIRNLNEKQYFTDLSFVYYE